MLFASAGSLSADGWTVEFAIPFKSIRYPARGAGEAHRWGLQIDRDIQGRAENIWYGRRFRARRDERPRTGGHARSGMINLSMEP